LGYLNNSKVNVDAILTLKGRELLSKGQNSSNITQFALGDDEIDYTLWNPNDTRGTAFYGSVIENMPVTEAIPDQTKALKYRLLTLPGNNSQYIPKIAVNPAAPSSIDGAGGLLTLNVETLNFANANTSLGYTAILSDSSWGTLTAAAGQSLGGNPPVTGDAGSIAVLSTGTFNFQVNANPSFTSNRYATITFFANETGGEVTVNITQLKRTTTAAATLSS